MEYSGSHHNADNFFLQNQGNLKNVTQTTSAIAEAKGAILAVNGDYYGANRQGYVIKNGVVYRDSVRNDAQYDDLVIYEDGSV